MPKRRLRLPRVAAITSLGGSDRVLWMTTQQDPHRLDVLPLVNRGQPKAHELPEPIAHVSGHPHTDAVICIGADTGRIYAIDLDGRTRLRTIAVPGIDRAEAAALVVHSGALSVIAAQAGRPIGTAAIEVTRDSEPVAAPLPPIVKSQPVPIAASRSSLYDEPEPDQPRTVSEALRRTLAARQAAETPPQTIEEARADALPPVERPRSVAEALRRPGPPTLRPSPLEAEQPPTVQAEIAGDEPPRAPAPTAWSEGASELMAKQFTPASVNP
jgi:hypothetical protein